MYIYIYTYIYILIFLGLLETSGYHGITSIAKFDG